MKTKIIIVTICLLVVGAVWYGMDRYKKPIKETTADSSNITQKCPDDYAKDDAGSAEYLAAMDKWTNDFYDAHPGATLSDWSVARYQFWVDNNCTAALQRYQEAKEGKADPATMERIEQEATAIAHIASLKCPEDYKTEDEKVNALLSFFNNYVDAHPEVKGDIKAFMTGRTDFLIEHNCIATLINFGYDGKSPIDAQVRQELITAMVNNANGQ